MEIGGILRKARIDAKMSVEQISNILKECGYKASIKTVYSWENGNSRPDIEILMKLCDVYGIKDILKTFGYDGYKEDGSIQLNMKEVDMVEKYRFVSKHSPDGAKVVDTVLEREYSIADKIKNQKRLINEMNMETAEEIIPIRIISYHQKLASAGTGQVIFNDMDVERIQIPDIPKYRRVSYAIGVNGNSMEPLYYDGDILLIEPTCEVEVGEIGIFLVDGQAFVKKLGVGELISLNKDYDNIPLTEYSNCMGKVVGKL